MSTELSVIPYQEVEKMAIAVSKSQLFGAKTPEQALVLLLLAQAEGLHPMIAARDYDIIQNKPAKKSEAMMRSFQQAGGSVEWIELTDTVAKAKFIPPQGSSIVIDWTIERAKKAGLLDKNGSMYNKYPRRMLSARCISEGIKTVWPSATSGLLSPEEVLDIPKDEYVKPDTKKSRIETIVDSQVSDAEIVKSEPDPKTETSIPEPIPVPAPEPKEIKTIIGLIEEKPEAGKMVEKDGKPQLKYVFKIDGKNYGTFDTALVKGIMECADKRIMVKFGYTERISPKGNVLNDIVNFSQATINEVPI